MSDLVSISEYAKETGVSKQAVSKAVDKLVGAGLLATQRQGRSIVFSRSSFERAKRGAGDPARELAIDMARPAGDQVEPPAGPPPSAAAADDPYRQAAGAEKLAKAQMAQIELQRLRGDLVERDKVVKGQMHAARAARNAIMAACGTAADRVAALPDAKDNRAVKTVITATMKEALTALADAMPTWTGAEDVPKPGDG